MFRGRKPTRAERIATKLEQVEERMHVTGTLRQDLRLQLRTDGESYWLAYLNADDEGRTSAVIGNTLRDAEMWVNGFAHSVYTLTEDAFMALGARH